jgi:hypothetical protein
VLRPQRGPTTVASTTMSSSFPPEIFDIIVDQLREEPTALKACCVVSKSWIHRTRKHFFARVEFHSSKSHIELWNKAFPDPSCSPAHHTRHLSIHGLSPVTAADADVDGWIRTFQNVVHLNLERLGSEDYQVSLAPFRGLSPTLRSLRLDNTSSEVLGLICSFPLLEDLALISPGRGGRMGAWNTSSTLPKLTGSLDVFGWIFPAALQLSRLPNGPHFTKVAVGYLDDDVTATSVLVSTCSNTLESLSVYCYSPGALSLTLMSGQYLTTTCGSRCVYGASA